MKFKRGVYVRGAGVPLLTGLLVMDTVYKSFGEDMVVTSVADGEHSEKSKHWSGAAADLRTRDLTVDPYQLASAARESLPSDFDVVVERDHIHLEFDPKGRMP